MDQMWTHCHKFKFFFLYEELLEEWNIMNTNKNLTKLIYAALLTALACVATMVIRVPTIGTNGYVNIGDSIVLISAWLLGNPYGALAAGLGSALADLLAGYGSYVPGTFVIKFAMAFVASILFKVLSKNNKPILKQVAYIISAIVAELIMVFGYFAYEALLLGYGIGAASSIISNLIQGITCLIIGVILINALNASKSLGKLMA